MAPFPISQTSSSYWMVPFDRRGRERTGESPDWPTLTSTQLLAAAPQLSPTDVFVFSHGWKGDVPSTKTFYERWFGAMLARADDIARMGDEFRPLWIGVHWPSQPFGDEALGGSDFSGSAVTPDEAQAAYAEFFADEGPAAAPLLDAIFARHRAEAGALSMPDDVRDRYRELAKALGYSGGQADGPPEADGCAFDAEAAFEAELEAGDAFAEGAVIAGLLSPLRQLSFWLMKKRARVVGEWGVNQLVAQLQAVLPAARFHLAGHSFGCVVVSGALGGPDGKGGLPRPVDSLSLVQGAVSLWAYADRIMQTAKRGYFNGIVRKGAIRGVTVTTRSLHDRAVGLLYPLAVGLVGQVSLAETLPLFGGIGSWGIQGCSDAADRRIGGVGENYGFKAGEIVNLEGSDFIAGHSEIFVSELAHVIWQAASSAR